VIPPEANADFVAAMEAVLAVYARPPDPTRPLVCFDECGKDLKAQARPPRPAAPGRLAQEDAEYVRHGSVNGFVAVAPHQGWRHVLLTERRTARDFAQAVRGLIDEQFPTAERIVLVTDNLNIHRPGALYQAFPPAEAWRLLSKIEWHYTPVHGSWLNLAELELSVLQRQCWGRRLPDRDTLVQETTAWVSERNAAHVGIAWRFTQADARERLPWLYPQRE